MEKPAYYFLYPAIGMGMRAIAYATVHTHAHAAERR
jgi:hypothetical protein